MNTETMIEAVIVSILYKNHKKQDPSEIIVVINGPCPSFIRTIRNRARGEKKWLNQKVSILYKNHKKLIWTVIIQRSILVSILYKNHKKHEGLIHLEQMDKRVNPL